MLLMGPSVQHRLMIYNSHYSLNVWTILNPKNSFNTSPRFVRILLKLLPVLDSTGIKYTEVLIWSTCSWIRSSEPHPLLEPILWGLKQQVPDISSSLVTLLRTRKLQQPTSHVQEVKYIMALVTCNSVMLIAAFSFVCFSEIIVAAYFLLLPLDPVHFFHYFSVTWVANIDIWK